MMPKVFNEVIDLGDGRTISLETGKLAKQAHGSVVVQMGKNHVALYRSIQLQTE